MSLKIIDSLILSAKSTQDKTIIKKYRKRYLNNLLPSTIQTVVFTSKELDQALTNFNKEI